MTMEQPPPQQPTRYQPAGEPAIVEHGRYNFRAAAAVGLVVGVVDVLIAGRFLLKLLGASDASSFVSFIYGVTAPLVGPFRGIFSNTGSAGNVFEPAALVAMAVYALIGWGAVALIRIATAPKGAKPATS
jgi:YGGT family